MMGIKSNAKKEIKQRTKNPLRKNQQKLQSRELQLCERRFLFNPHLEGDWRLKSKQLAEN